MKMTRPNILLKQLNRRGILNMKTIKKPTISHYLNFQLCEDFYLLDDYNAILIKKKFDNQYFMVHVRLINQKLYKVNEWSAFPLAFNNYQKNLIINQRYFKISNEMGRWGALYDFLKGTFVIPPKVWDSLDFGLNDSYIQAYGGVLASFQVESDVLENDVINYFNPLTNQMMQEIFKVTDGTYYAIVTLDGKIKNDKIFKGSSFAKITKIIDLKKYDSVLAFKQRCQEVCNLKKENLKDQYQKKMKLRNNESISPYLDYEVIEALGLKKKSKKI